MNPNEEDTNSAVDENSLLQPAVQAWKVYLRDQGRSRFTLKAFSGDLSLLEQFLPVDYRLKQITQRDLEDYLRWLETGRGVPCSPKTLSRRITSLKSFFRWLSKYGILATDPSEKILPKNVTSPLPLALSREESLGALEVASEFRTGPKADPRPYVLLRLLLETGLKKGECLNLTVNHFEVSDPENAFVHVRYSNKRLLFKERRLPLSAEWVQAWQEYVQLYQISTKAFPWSPRRLEYLLEDISKALKTEKHISFDMLRWTSALNDLVNGEDTNKIRQKMGVSPIQWREISRKLQDMAREQGYSLLPVSEVSSES